MKHSHPLTEGEYKKEIVPTLPYAGEGCEEHYDERIVKKDAVYDLKGKLPVHDREEILRTMVIGEAIATPRCRNPYIKNRR